MAENKIAYLELPSKDVPALKAFYGQLFGWTFQDFGDDYAAIEGAGLDGGFNGDPDSKPKAPLAIIERRIWRPCSSRYRRLAAQLSCRHLLIRGVNVFIS
jgi:hypothetical protein